MGLSENSLIVPSFLDGLYCEEEILDLNEECVRKAGIFPLILLEQGLVEECDELATLKFKEQIINGVLIVARKEAVEWMIKVNAHYGFSTLTCVLGINYFDRFISSSRFQSDKPWMSQLAAVACISLAAKVEETQVPLLIDLQVEESKYVFEARTIKRMELLVLSTLEWKMNPVTPLSFVDHIIRFKTNLHCEFLCKCERLLLSIILDARIVCYLPSVLAAATMMYVIEEIEPCDSLEYKNKLMDILKISQEQVDECYDLIVQLLSGQGRVVSHKRKYHTVPGSPNGVIDMSFSCENLNDSWAVSSEPLLKKSRAQEQHMVSLDVLRSPH